MLFRLFLFCSIVAFIHCDDLPDGVEKIKTIDEMIRDRKGDAEERGENDGEMREGDIAVPEGGEEGADRNMINGDRYRWPKNKRGIVKVPYVLDDTFNGGESGKAKLLSAIKDYRLFTCINIVPRTDQKDYIQIISASGCWSYVGKQGGMQKLSLGTGCSYDVGTPTHELMHALGFNHEQTRSDRDKYVTIVYDKIKPKYKFAFNICPEPRCSLPNFPYDTTSVMQYGKGSFTIDGSDTILAKNNTGRLGQRIGLSNLDIKKLDQMYECNGKTVEKNNGVRPLERLADETPSHCQTYKRACADPKDDYKLYRQCKKTCKNMVKGSNFDVYPGCPNYLSRCKESWFKDNCANTCGHPRPTNRD